MPGQGLLGAVKTGRCVQAVVVLYPFFGSGIQGVPAHMENNMFHFIGQALAIGFIGPGTQKLLKIDIITSIHRHANKEGYGVKLMLPAAKVRMPFALQSCLAPKFPKMN